MRDNDDGGPCHRGRRRLPLDGDQHRRMWRVDQRPWRLVDRHGGRRRVAGQPSAPIVHSLRRSEQVQHSCGETKTTRVK
jgi:hypothetical protein